MEKKLNIGYSTSMLTLESLDWKLIHNVTKNAFYKNNAFEVALKRRLWEDYEVMLQIKFTQVKTMFTNCV